ncbi:hypothetical protein [Synechococcus sp. EJ6-Ellesmere]|uniref:hypothetical protein n=1 Tax=Synechococcus sp. EJ6-Ellesmere TaxID=2823734 RepID=UPI0020CF44F7|nr:hypothetical protein [Synechococcus sp. EJ6-Ellesmere]
MNVVCAELGRCGDRCHQGTSHLEECCADHPVLHRPSRQDGGHCHTKEEFLKLWFEGPESFSRNPPNATLSILEPGKPDLLNVVVQLRNPRLNGNNLLYDIKLVEGVLPASGDAAVLFIDVLGFWRRNVRRVAIVGTSTAIAASPAVSASEATAAEASATPPAATMVPPPALPRRSLSSRRCCRRA